MTTRHILLVAVGSVLCLPAFVQAESPHRIFTREAFDRLDQSINAGNGYKSGSASQIAWGESYIMIAYVEMYRATQDTYYLDKLVDHADHVLKQRDDNRGFKDYSGRSRAAWSVAGEYTVAELVLQDAHGNDALKFRSVPYAYNHKTKLRVTTRPADDRFDLQIENDRWPPKEEYRGLSMDPQSPDFIERKLNACKNVALERKLECADTGSKLVTVEVLGDAKAPPAKDAQGQALGNRQVPMTPLFMAYHGYSGQATFGMLDFAWLVENDTRLQRRYGAHARRYVAEAIEVFSDAEEEWRSGPAPDEGHYISGHHGAPFWCDGVGKAHNYQASLGRSLLRLAQLTGDRRWQGHTEAIARLLKRRLRVTEDDAYVWNYWWGLPEQGWTRENSPSFNTPTWPGRQTIEDTSHGHLEMEFVSLCAHAGCVFDEKDLRRFARTFLNKMVDRRQWAMSVRVDGSGGWGKHHGVLGGWMQLAAWNPEVAEVGLKIAETHNLHEKATGGGLMTLARLIKWSQGENANQPPP